MGLPEVPRLALPGHEDPGGHPRLHRGRSHLPQALQVTPHHPLISPRTSPLNLHPHLTLTFHPSPQPLIPHLSPLQETPGAEEGGEGDGGADQDVRARQGAQLENP